MRSVKIENFYLGHSIMKRSVIFISLAGLLLLGCARPPVFTGDQPWFELQKTTCRGECPAFVIKIYSSGYALYEGGVYASRKGLWYAKLSPEEIENFKKILRSNNVFSFEDKYTSFRPDLPTTYLTVYMDDKVKAIKDYDKAPSSLKELENTLIVQIEKIKWRRY